MLDKHGKCQLIRVIFIYLWKIECTKIYTMYIIYKKNEKYSKHSIIIFEEKDKSLNSIFLLVFIKFFLHKHPVV